MLGLEHNIKISYPEKVGVSNSCIHSIAKYLLSTGFLLNSRKIVISSLAIVHVFMELSMWLERQLLDRYIHR